RRRRHSGNSSAHESSKCRKASNEPTAKPTQHRVDPTTSGKRVSDSRAARYAGWHPRQTDKNIRAASRKIGVEARPTARAAETTRIAPLARPLRAAPPI